MTEHKPSVHEGVEYLVGTVGSLILACDVCGEEHFRDAHYYWTHLPSQETCFECKKLMEPIRMDELESRWKPFWRQLELKVTADPHAIQVYFMNKDNDYRKEDCFVYLRGYSVDGAEEGTEKATKFRDLVLLGNVNREQALKMGRFLKARDYGSEKGAVARKDMTLLKELGWTEDAVVTLGRAAASEMAFRKKGPTI